jgi:hypothetical protein
VESAEATASYQDRRYGAQREESLISVVRSALDAAFSFRWRTSTLLALVFIIAVALLTLRGEVFTSRSAVHALIVVLVIVAMRLRT